MNVDWTKKKGFIFDLDGTLLDSLGLWAEIDEIFLAERGVSPVPEGFQAMVGHMGIQRSAEWCVETFGFSDTPEELIDLWDRMAVDKYASSLQLKPGAMEFLQVLKDRQIPMAVATASPMRYVLPCLTRLGILDWFQTIVSVDEVAHGKGSPDIYEEAARRLQLPVSDCLVFEDTLQSIHGAKLGHFDVIGVAEAAYRDIQDQVIAEADGFIEAFCDLL